jgi:hypothetical protein
MKFLTVKILLTSLSLLGFTGTASKLSAVFKDNTIKKAATNELFATNGREGGGNTGSGRS